jgi:hypothetical protein
MWKYLTTRFMAMSRNGGFHSTSFSASQTVELYGQFRPVLVLSDASDLEQCILESGSDLSLCADHQSQPIAPQSCHELFV